MTNEDEPRYYVNEIIGWPVTSLSVTKTAGHAKATASYSVLDRYDAHREVARFYTVPGGKRETTNRKLAEAEARRLNKRELAEAV